MWPACRLHNALLEERTADTFHLSSKRGFSFLSIEIKVEVSIDAVVHRDSRETQIYIRTQFVFQNYVIPKKCT